MCDAPSDSKFPQGYTDRVNRASLSMIADLNARFRDRLRGLVRREMGRRFQRREDSEDVVQEVLMAFYSALAQKTTQLDHSSGLWPLLKQFTHYKVLQHVDYHIRPPRDIGRERDVEPDHVPPVGPTEADAVEVVDALETAVGRMLRVLATLGLKADDVEIVRGKLRGQSSKEVARQADCSVAKVNRTMAWVRSRFEELLEEDPSDGREPHIEAAVDPDRGV
jgi:DNA-directed RNA polymerase specialized sigma24 family protein